MKHVSVALTVLMVCMAVLPVSAQTAQPAPAPEKEFSWTDIPGNILRGVLNIVTCPAEIVRNLYFEQSMSRGGGWIFTGTVYGFGYMIGRCFIGAVDICTLGLTGDNLYSSELFPEYVWDAAWTTAHEKPPVD